MRVSAAMSGKKKLSLIILGISFVVLVFAPSAYLQGIFNNFTEVLAAYTAEHPVSGPAVFIGLAAASVLLGPFSSIPLVPAAVALWDIVPTFIYLMTGWLVGNSGAYAIGKFAGQPVVGKLVGRKRMETWIAQLEHHLHFLVLFVFRLAVPSETGYIFGIISYPFRAYLLITFLAELPFALLAVYAGDAFFKTSWGILALLLSLWVAIIGIAYWFFIKRFNEIDHDESPSV